MLGLFHSTNKVLVNPRWSQLFKVFKAKRASDGYGRAAVEEETITVLGVIQPSSGEDLDRLEEGDRGNQAITVWTNTALSSGTEGELPDEVEWRGTRYMVRNVRDWEDYGPGFCQAICVAQEMKGRAT